MTNNISDCAKEWFKNTVEVNKPGDPVDLFISRLTTLEDREGFQQVIDVMVDGGMLVILSTGKLTQGLGCSIVTALLLGAHLSKEGHL